MPEVRRYPVGMSVEAIAGAWARQEQAPHGSVVVLANEISGRLRGGVPWKVGEPDGLMMAMIARPEIPPMKEALLWLCTAVAVAEACDSAITAGPGAALHQVGWPDAVTGPDGSRFCQTNVVVQLGPGRIEHAVLAVRADLAGLDTDADELLGALFATLEAAVDQLQSDSLATIDQFTDRCSILNQKVKVTLMPRGEARGTVAAIDHEGFLVLQSGTGMVERIAPASLRSIELL